MSERSNGDKSPSGGIERPLYTILERATGKEYKVVYWEDYGPVAPSLWTTNGSVLYVARLTAEYVCSGFFEIRDPHIEADFRDARALAKVLKRICQPELVAGTEEDSPL